MGFMKNLFAKLEEEVGNSLSKSATSTSSKAQRRASGPPPTRWEKAVLGLDKIVVQVVKVDPDGVYIVCVGSEGGIEGYRNIKKTKGLEDIVDGKTPSGVSKFTASRGFSRHDIILCLFMTGPRNTHSVYILYRHPPIYLLACLLALSLLDFNT